MDKLLDLIYTVCEIGCEKCDAVLEESGTTEDAFAERLHNKGWVVVGRSNTIHCPKCAAKLPKPQPKKKK